MRRSAQRIIRKVAQAGERHRERHRPTGFGFALADSIAYLDAAHWDRVASNASLFLSRLYLQILEEHSCQSVCQRYALVYRARQPVAAVVMQLAEVSATQMVQVSKAGETEASGLRRLKASLTPAAQHLRDGALNRLKTRVLVCGNLLTWGMHGVTFAEGENVPQLWPAIAEALFRVRRAERLSGQTDVVMVKDLSESQSQNAEALERFSYRALETEPNMVLEFQPGWRTYDDYLGSLSSSYRKSARRIFKEVEEAGCQVRHSDRLDAVAHQLHSLYLQVHGNARLRLVTIPVGYLPALAEVAGTGFRCTVVEQSGRMLGFVTTLKDRDTAVGYLIGFDREASASIPIYLRLLHAVIADSLELGCTRLSLGRTALEPKARLGARPQPFHVWLRHRQPVLNLFVRNLLRSISHEEAPERHPFR